MANAVWFVLFVTVCAFNTAHAVRNKNPKIRALHAGFSVIAGFTALVFLQFIFK